MIREEVKAGLIDEYDWADALADGFMQFEAMQGVKSLRFDGYGPYVKEDRERGAENMTMYTALIEVGSSWGCWMVGFRV